MSEVVFRTQGGTYKYPGGRDSFTLRSPEFHICASDTIGIVGPSGGGKSTLLRIMSGSLPTKDFLFQAEASALIYQDLRLVGEKTALENALMGALGELPWYHSQFSKEYVEEAQRLLEALGLAEHLDRPVSGLSGGQKQRVAIARALMKKPKLLLADEPFSHLDHKTALQTFTMLKSLQSQLGFSMVITIHSNELSDFNFDKVWQVQDGLLHLGASNTLSDTALTKMGERNPRLTGKLGLFLLMVFFIASLMQLPTLGFVSEQAPQELFGFFKKLFIHSPAALQEVDWRYLLDRMKVTIQMAFLATTISFLVSLPLALLSTEGLSRRFLVLPVRSFLMVIRSIPALVWALFFVAGLGLGPVAGVVALSVYSVGYLSKFLYEGIEDMDRKAFDALRALGASRWQSLTQGVLPSSRHIFVSHYVFMLEYNVRSASLLGLVGAGGIGQDLMFAIEWRDYPRVFAILTLLVVVVVFFDLLSISIRKHYRKLRGI